MPADDRHWYPRVLDGDLLAFWPAHFILQTKSSRCPCAHSTGSMTMNLTQVTSPSRASCIRTAAAIPWFDIRIDTRTTLCHYAPLPSSNLTTMLKTTPDTATEPPTTGAAERGVSSCPAVSGPRARLVILRRRSCRDSRIAASGSAGVNIIRPRSTRTRHAPRG